MTLADDSFTFTVGKLDAGMAILLGERAHLIEFPSVLLPPGATAGSIVNISVNRNHEEEVRRDAEFWALQDEILNEFGVETPQPPKLQLRNVTQTSVTLEWPSLQLAKANLRSLDIYRNGQRLGMISSPMTNTSTKFSGLEIYTDYAFQLILRTTAGTFPSNVIRVRTHSMVDTSGICVCFGNVQDPVLLEDSKTAFVCTTPAATPTGARVTGGSAGAPGVEYQRALQLSIPVVQPHWILACHTEKKMIPIASFYLGATPPPTSASFVRRQSLSVSSAPRSSTSQPPTGGSHSTRASVPVTSSSRTAPASVSTYVGQLNDEQQSHSEPNIRSAPPFEATAEDDREGDGEGSEEGKVREEDHQSLPQLSAHGEMNRSFKFPRSLTEMQSGNGRPSAVGNQNLTREVLSQSEDFKSGIITPSIIEVPPPPPVEKEISVPITEEDLDEEVGDIVDIPLN